MCEHKNSNIFLRSLEKGQFDYPSGIAIDSQGNYVIADKYNHRIQVFTPEGLFLRSFGEKGSEYGQFRLPSDLAIDYDGKLPTS